ncbi:MAG TPA: DUF4382 domain-containing protein [Gammaproteobacteria bacterium]|nr:DUF4382 domain-containing protein [Gammaproteobacteria bacterium]
MRTRHINIYLLLSMALAAAVFAGCNGSSSTATPSGVLNLSVSDTPVDGATSVMVTFTGVEIQPAGGDGGDDQGSDGMDHDGAPSAATGTIIGGPMDDADPGDTEEGGGDNDGAPSSGTSSAPSSATSPGDMDSDDSGAASKPLTFTFPTPRQIDLMQQQGGSSAMLLSGVNLPAGNYTWIRLIVASSGNTITLSDGSVHTLTIPSGDETGLKLVRGFTVAAGGVVNFTIDFDLRKSIILANGQYILKPVLRIVNNVDVGRINGSVANTFMIGTTSITDPACMPAAYIYAGANVPPVDINPSAVVQPVATASVKLDDDSGSYRYSAGFLAPGAYTVALVCAAGDNPATVDSLTFSTPKNATVASDSSVAVDFP